MTGEVVNLRKARKARQRAAREAVAAENRVRHGTPKGERRAEEARTDLALRRLDAHRLDKPGGARREDGEA